MNKTTVVSIADMKISSNPDDVLVTYSLGSCIAIVLYDPYKKIGGMMHVMLPDSSIDKNANINPFKYVDLGLPILFKNLFKLGCKRGSIVTSLIGGSNVMDKNNYFNIGERNYQAIRKMLWRNNVIINNEDIGGSKSRTVRLYIDSGKIIVSNAKEEYEL
ncbi:MAG: chemotaxis protein CheD [Candidatus Cloacimonadales bacterium]|jgi:chemotaxis protein CheD|nr:chemotaxis protein CheD [Candidatus Cloacimonadota bacterium]MDD2649616.1 chemotaxis protein CheD [Candidatus Cloacimonadota bacterium]MDD3501643.1 chemotaxis protein CheD [Candidatus Cloacimonadota bacterium]MDX9976606.1 chemotaxis protein CheD [Candidatus Cloacimonadales bacterium]